MLYLFRGLLFLSDIRLCCGLLVRMLRMILVLRKISVVVLCRGHNRNRRGCRPSSGLLYRLIRPFFRYRILRFRSTSAIRIVLMTRGR